MLTRLPFIYHIFSRTSKRNVEQLFCLYETAGSTKRPSSIFPPSPTDALTTAHTPTLSNTPLPHTTRHNNATTDDSPTSTQNCAPPTNDAPAPQNPSPHETHSPTPHKTPPTTTPINPPCHTPHPQSQSAPTDTDKGTPSNTTRAPRASDTSAGETHTPSTLPCESTTICRLRPFIFLPPS